MRFQKRPLGVDFPPPFAAFDHCFELRQPFEGNRSGKFHTLAVEYWQDLLAEKGRVHARFQHRSGQMRLGLRQTVEHEFAGTVGIMDIAGTMVKIEKLTGLRY